MLLRNLNFPRDFFSHVEKRLDKKVKLIFKIYNVTTRETNIMYILHNISRSKGNQTMDFGQVAEYQVNIR